MKFKKFILLFTLVMIAVTLLGMTALLVKNKSLPTAIKPLSSSHFAKGSDITAISPNMTIYSLVPWQTNLGWKIELFDASEKVAPHFHKIQTQLVLVLEGSANFHAGEYSAVLSSGQFIVIPPKTLHSIEPQESVRFLAIDLPGFQFPKDAYFENPTETSTVAPFIAKNIQSRAIVDHQTQLNSTLLTTLKAHSPIPEAYYHGQINYPNYTVFPLVTEPESRWSIAILELKDAPKHFHKIETEHFLVLNGELDIELDGVHHHLTAGQSAHVPPGVTHHLTSASNGPVRLLCVSFPAQ